MVIRTKAAFRQMSLSELQGYRREVEDRLERAQEGLSPYSMKDIDRELDWIDEIIAEKEERLRSQEEQEEKEEKKDYGSQVEQLRLDL